MRTASYRPKSKNTSFHLPLWLLLLVALLAGLCFFWALEPYGVWVLALLSPLIFYALLLLKITPKQAFLIGLAYGFGVWQTGGFWLYTSIHEYGNIATPIAFGMVSAVALVMGLFHGLLAWVFVRFCGRQPLAFASLWVLQEWLKTWVLTGFPWLFVGYAYTSVPFVLSLAPMVGVFGISFLSVLVSSSVVEVYRHKAGFLLLGFLGVLAGVGLYLANPTWTKATGEKLSVSLVQGNVSQDIKWISEYQGEIMQNYAELTQTEWGQDLIVWPEAAITVFQDEAEPFLNQASLIAQLSDTTLATGIPYREMTQAGDKYFNSLMVLGRDTGVYKKQRLVPFSEYVPLQDVVDIMPAIMDGLTVISNTKGDKNQPTITIKNKAMGVAICYEVAYPTTVRHNAKNSQFMLTVSNDAWFGTSAGPYQHLQMVKMRAMETGRWFVRSTNTGITAIIDDKGQIIAQAPQFERTVLRGQVQMRQGKTPYVKWGDYPVLAISVVLVLLSMWAGKNQRYFQKDGKFYQDYR